MGKTAEILPGTAGWNRLVSAIAAALNTKPEEV
jgi:hypothetical protein